MSTLASDYRLIAIDRPTPAGDETWRLLRRAADDVVAGFLAWRTRRRDARLLRRRLAEDPAEIEFTSVDGDGGRLLVVIQPSVFHPDIRS